MLSFSLLLVTYGRSQWGKCLDLSLMSEEIEVNVKIYPLQYKHKKSCKRTLYFYLKKIETFTWLGDVTCLPPCRENTRLMLFDGDIMLSVEDVNDWGERSTISSRKYCRATVRKELSYIWMRYCKATTNSCYMRKKKIRRKRTKLESLMEYIYQLGVSIAQLFASQLYFWD